MALHPDRLFPADPGTRAIARQLYQTVQSLPIVSPHGHTDPSWYAEDKPFPDPAALFITPDHYATRMLYSQGVRLEDLGVARRDGAAVETDPRTWLLLAAGLRTVADAASAGELQLSGARAAEIATLLPVVPLAP